MNPAVGAAAAAAAIWVLLPAPDQILARRLPLRGERPSRRLTRRAVVLAAPVALLLWGATVGTVGLLLSVAVGVVAATLIQQVRRSVARATIRTARADSVAAVELLAADLRAGALPGVALRALAEEFDELGTAARVAHLGGDVPAALRRIAAEPGREGIGELAAAWQLAEQAGAPLVDALARVADASREAEEVRAEVIAGVEPARATARVMAGLPLLALALGSGIGGNPVHVISGTVAGAVSVTLGVALAGAGLVWVDRVTDQAEAGR